MTKWSIIISLFEFEQLDVIITWVISTIIKESEIAIV